MKCVITGALGHIGSSLIRKLPLFFDNPHIVMIDNLSTQRYSSLFNLPSQATYEFIENDVQKIFWQEILKNIENYDRGFYSGIFGIFDGINLQSFVLIRFIENINNELFYKSGGGITSDSIAKEEYEELLNKVYLPF